MKGKYFVNVCHTCIETKMHPPFTYLSGYIHLDYNSNISCKLICDYTTTFRQNPALHSMRTLTAILTLAICLFSLLLVMGWISQEKEVYDELLRYQRQLQSYHNQCLRTKSWERIEHKMCPLGFVSTRGKCSKCPQGTFSLPRWTSCVKYLTCDDLMTDIRPTKPLWRTERWRYVAAEWNSFRVVYSQSIQEESAEDDSSSATESAWKTAIQLAPHENILYPVGSCPHTNTLVYSVTDEIYPLTQLETLLERNNCNNWMVRFKLAMDYIRLLHYLHLHPSGPYVLCNSGSLDTLLSQFALSQHFDLLLADFENLPGGHDPVVCSREELRGSFVAPEQTWPYSQYRMFNPDEQPGYFHTSDLWKVPDVTQWLLGNSKESQNILNYLSIVHHRCKSTDFTWRPSAKEILTEYESIWSALIGNNAGFDDR